MCDGGCRDEAIGGIAMKALKFAGYNGDLAGEWQFDRARA